MKAPRTRSRRRCARCDNRPVLPGQPVLVASQTSGVDGSSEGGRISTTRLPQTLVLYSVPLIDELRRSGYKERVTSEPALLDGGGVIQLIPDGERPPRA